MLDHIGISASDYRKSRAFYVDALMPLGIDQGGCGIGKTAVGIAVR